MLKVVRDGAMTRACSPRQSPLRKPPKSQLSLWEHGVGIRGSSGLDLMQRSYSFPPVGDIYLE